MKKHTSSVHPRGRAAQPEDLAEAEEGQEVEEQQELAHANVTQQEDPDQAPIVRNIFELFANAAFSETD